MRRRSSQQEHAVAAAVVVPSGRVYSFVVVSCRGGVMNTAGSVHAFPAECSMDIAECAAEGSPGSARRTVRSVPAEHASVKRIVKH